MSNRLVIEPTEFINSRTGDKSYGIRVYDDYEQLYDNNWESIPDDDVEVYHLAKESAKISEMLSDYWSSTTSDDPVIMIGQNTYTKAELGDEDDD